MTDGSSLKATGPSFPTPPISLTEGQCFAYCRVNWKFLACPCLIDFIEQRQLRNEPLAVALLFSRAKIRSFLLFSKEFGSWTEVRQLLNSRGAKSKSWPMIKDYDCSSWLNRKRPAKRRHAKIWLIIVHSLDNFIRSELPAWKSDMAEKELGKRRKMWYKLRTWEPFYTILQFRSR